MIKRKVEQYSDRVTTSKSFGYAADQIGRNLGSGQNNQNLGGHVNQAAAQLLHVFTSNGNT
jgi:hypothetical protein